MGVIFANTLVLSAKCANRNCFSKDFDCFFYFAKTKILFAKIQFFFQQKLETSTENSKQILLSVKLFSNYLFTMTHDTIRDYDFQNTYTIRPAIKFMCNLRMFVFISRTSLCQQ